MSEARLFYVRADRWIVDQNQLHIALVRNGGTERVYVHDSAESHSEAVLAACKAFGLSGRLYPAGLHFVLVPKDADGILCP